MHWRHPGCHAIVHGTRTSTVDTEIKVKLIPENISSLSLSLFVLILIIKDR